MDLIGQQGTPASEGMFAYPKICSMVTVELDDTYDDLASHFAEDVFRLAQDYPETTGKFTITSVQGFHIAQEFRVENGKMYRRNLDDAPEQEVFLQPARNGLEMLLSERDLEGIKSLQNNERKTHGKRRQRPALNSIPSPSTASDCSRTAKETKPSTSGNLCKTNNSRATPDAASGSLSAPRWTNSATSSPKP